ncbi:MAG: hypothetical protein FWG25_05740 [Promicromonosporaceae bacterium]|nr:hypothetical protein [Promicromonosporaceae bacterium]
MSYVNDPNDPNYVAANNTVPPVAEAVEPTSNPLRWLWWLLGLLVLAGLIWALVHACDRDDTGCTALPSSVWTTAVQDSTWTKVMAFDTVNFTETNRAAVMNELVRLCNVRLAGGGASIAATYFTDNAVWGGYGLTTTTTDGLRELVNGTTFCRCS